VQLLPQVRPAASGCRYGQQASNQVHTHQSSSAAAGAARRTSLTAPGSAAAHWCVGGWAAGAIKLGSCCCTKAEHAGGRGYGCSWRVNLHVLSRSEDSCCSRRTTVS
jgi:hypothetical protein